MSLMQQRFQILGILADGRLHSAKALAASLGISHQAIEEQVRSLRCYGLDVDEVSHKGYRLRHPIEFLTHERILARLTPLAQGLLARLDLYWETESTNQVLLERLAGEGIHGHACVVEFQTAGRGRRGNRWITPFGAGICVSVGWHLRAQTDSLTALSLATGVAVIRTLEKIGIHDAGLKWPNDVLWRDRKLGGILLETKGVSHGPTDLVIGVGLNVAFPETMIAVIDQPWIDITRILSRGVSRNELTAILLSELLDMLYTYEQQGFVRFIDEWRRYDLVLGNRVRLSLPHGDIVGEARDIDAKGALVVCVNGRVQRYLSGELSLRIAT